MLYYVVITLLLTFQQPFSLANQSDLFPRVKITNIFEKDNEVVTATNEDDDRHGYIKPEYKQSNPMPTNKPSSLPTSPTLVVENEDDDSHDDRHGYIKPTYNQNNPPPTEQPSSLPSKQPSSLPSCQISQNGSFGNTTGANIEREVVLFSFDAILNMTLLIATPGTDEEKVNQAVVPAIESQLSDLLLPSIFPQCNGNGSNATSSFSNLKGMSSQPKDIVGARICNAESSPAGDCFPIDAGLSWYYELPQRRRLQLDATEIENINDLLKGEIKNMMDNGLMNTAHPAILGLSYVEMNARPVIKPPTTIKSKEKNINTESGGSMLWLIGVGASVAVICTGVGIFVWRRKKTTTEEIECDSSESKA